MEKEPGGTFVFWELLLSPPVHRYNDHQETAVCVPAWTKECTAETTESALEVKNTGKTWDLELLRCSCSPQHLSYSEIIAVGCPAIYQESSGMDNLKPFLCLSLWLYVEIPKHGRDWDLNHRVVPQAPLEFWMHLSPESAFLLKFSVVLFYKPYTIVSPAQLEVPEASLLKKMYFPSTASTNLPTEKSLCLATLRT